MSEGALSLLVSAVGVIVSAVALQYARNKDHRDKVEEVMRRLAVLELQMQVFWKSVSFSAAQALHSPHTPELDRLIERFQQELLDDRELRKFKTMLSEIAASPDETAFRKKCANEVLTLIHIRYEVARGASEAEAPSLSA
jgi:hypothetical protein